MTASKARTRPSPSLPSPIATRVAKACLSATCQPACPAAADAKVQHQRPHDQIERGLALCFQGAILRPEVQDVADRGSSAQETELSRIMPHHRWTRFPPALAGVLPELPGGVDRYGRWRPDLEGGPLRPRRDHQHRQSPSPPKPPPASDPDVQAHCRQGPPSRARSLARRSRSGADRANLPGHPVLWEAAGEDLAPGCPSRRSLC